MPTKGREQPYGMVRTFRRRPLWSGSSFPLPLNGEGRMDSNVQAGPKIGAIFVSRIRTFWRRGARRYAALQAVQERLSDFTPP